MWQTPVMFFITPEPPVFLVWVHHLVLRPRDCRSSGQALLCQKWPLSGFVPFTFLQSPFQNLNSIQQIYIESLLGAKPWVRGWSPCCSHRGILGRTDIKIVITDMIRTWMCKTRGFLPSTWSLWVPSWLFKFVTSPYFSFGSSAKTQRVCLLLRIMRRGILYTGQGTGLGIGRSELKSWLCLQISWGKVL